ncbi:hypothetical protein KL909_003710 [Ogataea angusta]|nr:hypothetical protein KL909_003710 [Ogataea angusta]
MLAKTLLQTSGLLLTQLGAALAASSEFIMYGGLHSSDFPPGSTVVLQYNEDNIVGVFPDCSTCYNFTGFITDEGYYELTQTSQGYLDNPLYWTINDDTGLVTVNTTGTTEPIVIQTHFVYYSGTMLYSFKEVDYNSTYYLYFQGIDGGLSDLGTNYTATLVPRFENGSYYMSYQPDEAATTDELSTTMTHILGSSTSSSSSTTSTSSSTSTSSASSSSSSSSSAGAATLAGVSFGGAALLLMSLVF